MLKKTLTLTLCSLLLVLMGCGDSEETTPQLDAAIGTRLVGEPCVKNSDCQSIQCLTDEVAVSLGLTGVETHGGYCILFPCDPARNDEDCGGGAHCFDGNAYGADMFICLQTCTGASDCTRQDYECVEDAYYTGTGTPPKFCIPAGLIQWDGGVEDAGTTDDGGVADATTD